MKRYLFGCFLLLFLIEVASPVALASSRKKREHGEEIFRENGCLHCHTMGNVGGHKGPNLSGVGRKFKPSAIRKQIIEGGNEMPPFGDVFEQNELDNLVAYLHSCKAKPKQ